MELEGRRRVNREALRKPQEQIFFPLPTPLFLRCLLWTSFGVACRRTFHPSTVNSAQGWAPTQLDAVPKGGQFAGSPFRWQRGKHEAKGGQSKAPSLGNDQPEIHWNSFSLVSQRNHSFISFHFLEPHSCPGFCFSKDLVFILSSSLWATLYSSIKLARVGFCWQQSKSGDRWNEERELVKEPSPVITSVTSAEFTEKDQP